MGQVSLYTLTRRWRQHRRLVAPPWEAPRKLGTKETAEQKTIALGSPKTTTWRLQRTSETMDPCHVWTIVASFSPFGVIQPFASKLGKAGTTAKVVRAKPVGWVRPRLIMRGLAVQPVQHPGATRVNATHCGHFSPRINKNKQGGYYQGILSQHGANI